MALTSSGLTSNGKTTHYNFGVTTGCRNLCDKPRRPGAGSHKPHSRGY